MIRFYSIKENSSDISFNMIPEYVGENIGREGYYTLLAVDEKEGEEDAFAGIGQFYVDMSPGDMFYSTLTYIYVAENFRLQDVGYKMVQRINEILSKQEVDVITTVIPYNDKGEVLSDISDQEIFIFLSECGFISVKGDEGKNSRLFKLTRR